MSRALVAVLLSASMFAADEPSVWRLEWEDDFERDALGDAWFLRRGSAEIRDGSLVLSGSGATILVDRGFASDVRLEFQARANPDLPPCDLSAALGSSSFWGYGYLLAFGGNNNQLNQILGGGARKVDREPELLIEPGRTYHLAAIQEGRRLAYFVDGRKILESEDDDPVGGPGFDRVGLVTWNGMIVDWVRVYERATPAPDGPRILRSLPDLGYSWSDRHLEYSHLEYSGATSENVRRGIAAYNARDYAAARDALVSETPPTTASVVGLAYVFGDLAYVESPPEQETLARLAAEVAREGPDDPGRADFALAAEWFRRINLRSRDRRAVTRLVVAGAAHNPFYYKADLYRARYHYASAIEGADRQRVAEALEIFAGLKELWPDVLALRELTGERVAWGEEMIRDPGEGPAWARYLEESFVRQHEILRWWFTQRQSPDGQLGGGWGDDVEILRSWIPVASVTTAGETAIAGIERLADGVWTYALEDGFSPEIGDVEHSAEPSADALPGMMLLRYGDPLFVERNLRSAKTIRERFLGRNRRGHLQFRSAEFGADGLNAHLRAGGDTGYHARAMKHFLWLGWYGIPEARDVVLSWCDAWREATVAVHETKPIGFVPASLFFPSGGIDPPDGQPWYEPSAHYYGFPGITHKIHEALLAAHFLSGDHRFLEPVEAMLRLATTGPIPEYDASLPPDDRHNLLSHLVHHAHPDVLSVYRWLTRDTTYDPTILVRGSAAQRFQVTRSLDDFAADLERVARSLRRDWARRTSEVLQTDRAGLPGAEDVFGAYTGSVRDLSDTGTPTFAVTWETPDLHFAAIVTEATDSHLRVLYHGFHEVPWTVGLRPWRLRPGLYSLAVGRLVSDGRGPERVAWGPETDVTHLHRGESIAVGLEPRTTLAIDLRLRRGVDRPAVLPDLAIARRDVVRDGYRVRVSVHNIAGAPAGPFRVVVEQKTAPDAPEVPWTTVAEEGVAGLPAVRDFSSVIQDVELRLDAWTPGALLRVVVDPRGEVPEICKVNNREELR